jgi:hypothetical protein
MPSSSLAISVARRILRLPVAQAEATANAAGVTFRIGTEDGRGRMLNDNINYYRVTVEVVDGFVVSARPE